MNILGEEITEEGLLKEKNLKDELLILSMVLILKVMARCTKVRVGIVMTIMEGIRVILITQIISITVETQVISITIMVHTRINPMGIRVEASPLMITRLILISALVVGSVRRLVVGFLVETSLLVRLLGLACKMKMMRRLRSNRASSVSEGTGQSDSLK
ncbi:hypothetical protein R1flu_026391 [Riccia fluitans]|uniref:Uncharacterized protein n=1 Tax=Riccia fluitans TaxID=41844 RepID=A0ABD1XGK7_9MARC